MIINNQYQDPDRNENRESDGRYALKMESKSSVNRWMKKDEEDAKRREELEAMYGDDAFMYA